MSDLISTAIGVVVSVTFGIITSRRTVMCCTPDNRPNTLVFSDVKLLLEFEGYHAQQNNFLYMHPLFSDPSKDTLVVLLLLSYASSKQ